MNNETIVDAEGRVYKKYTVRIKQVEKWILSSKLCNYGNDSIYLFHYSGTEGFYSRPRDGRGPRLDIGLEFENKSIFQDCSYIGVNIYNEAMSILKYKRMSPKFVSSIERNINKTMDVYVADNQHIYVNIKQLMSLNYGYLH